MTDEVIEVRKAYGDYVIKLIKKGITISTMESCTAGLIASLLTDVEGASAAYKGGFVTYSNEAKIQAGVPKNVINDHGVYSKKTAQAMALAASRHFDTDIAVGITGTFANADPANADSAPGEVYVSVLFDGRYFDRALRLPEFYERWKYKLAVAKEVISVLELTSVYFVAYI